MNNIIHFQCLGNLCGDVSLVTKNPTLIPNQVTCPKCREILINQRVLKL